VGLHGVGRTADNQLPDRRGSPFLIVGPLLELPPVAIAGSLPSLTERAPYPPRLPKMRSASRTAGSTWPGLTTTCSCSRERSACCGAPGRI
jgi:hypothetical protein